ncbi:phosphate acyltransferase PlsX [Rubrobacter tropicus]|uniref:Phosphate acyltransferase n=1 Tax=Rubrobacter tropicus TaxID=2653851 RepID=A0A6G8Q938_9ACTN|nr:phosphate acyltransferase PlsX [Rubrobacter tropicus]QIN82938.1 phosphate acyltransferase PlsX [Rubrobacter tropicus]
MRLAVDALGGDNAPKEVVAGAIAAARRLPDDDVYLVGVPEEIEGHLGGTLPPNVSVHPADGPVAMDEEPAAALRSRPDASVAVAAKLVRAGEADAFFSAGSTGASVAAALLRVGRLDGCRRPAIATVLPLRNPVLLLDAGATTMCRPQDLLNFAILGGVFARRYFGLREEARIGLVNVGEEPGKGTDLARVAHGLIAASGLRFVGNVEGRDLGGGVADVLVTDGFTGNVVLKTAEGVAREVLGMVRSAVTGSLAGKLAGAALRPKLAAVREQVDPENYGGSFLLGVRGPVVIGHGNSMARGVENALLGISRSGPGLTDEMQRALLSASGEPA